MFGDFNTKVGTYKPTVTKGWIQLMKVMNNYGLLIINKEKEVFKGLCTRVQDQERSVLDYVLTNSNLLSIGTEMIIDAN